uniref:DNA-directed DNA polymerase n=1 Tax=Trichuris muris TaxID=70415 RepID=A0A5S6QI27_TRIMR
MCKQSEIYRARSIVAAAEALDLPEEAAKPIGCELSSGFVLTVLETIGNGMVKCEDDLSQFLSCTLSYASLVERWDAVQGCLQNLAERDFICSSEVITPTQLGCATVSSSMSPDEALAVFQDLQKAKSAVVLENDLHLVYLVTPLCMLENLESTISWSQYFAVWQSLDQSSRNVGHTVGIEESYLVQKLCCFGRAGRPERNARKCEVHLRFFVALALFQLVEEIPLAEVSARFSFNRGYLQSLQQQASTYAAMVISFVDRLGWFSLKNLLSGFAERLAFGVKQDLTELVQIDGIDGHRARRFHEAGLCTVAKLAQSRIKDICAILGKAVPFHSSLSGSSSRNNWLAGHSELTLFEAAQFVRVQARALLNDRLRQYGVTTNQMDDKGAEDEEKAQEHMPVTETLQRTVLIDKMVSNLMQESNAEEKFVISRSISTQERAMSTFRVNHSTPNTTTVKCDKSFNEFPTTHMVMSESWFEVSGHGLPIEPGNAELRVACKPAEHANGNVRISSDLDDALKMPQDGQCEHKSSCQSDDELALRDLLMVEQFLNDSWNQSSADIPPEKANDADQLAKNLSNVSLSPQPQSARLADVSITESQLMLLLSDSFKERIDAACLQPSTGNSKERSSACLRNCTRASPLVFEDSDEFRDRSGHTSNLKLSADSAEAQSSPRIDAQAGVRDCSLEVVLENVSPILTIGQSSLGRGCLPAFEGRTLGGTCFVDIGVDQAVCAEFFRLLEAQKEYFVSVAYNESALHTSRRCPKCHGIADQSARENRLISNSYSVAVCWNQEFCFYYTVPADREAPLNVADLLRRVLAVGSRSRKVIFDDLRRALRLIFSTLGKDFRAECNCFCMNTAVWMLDPDRCSWNPKEILEIFSPADLPLFEFNSVLLGHASACCISALATCAVWSKVYGFLEQARMVAAYKEIELPAQWMITEMESCGVGFDPTLCSRMCDSLKDRILALEFDSARLAGRQFSMSSPNEVAKVLFHELGLPADSSHLITRGTAKRYSTSKPVLEKLCSLHPLPGNVLQWRQLSFALSNYVYPLLKSRLSNCAACGEFARIYSKHDWFTATGRMIMHQPNLQTVPKSIFAPVCGKEVSLRNLVVARRGYVLLSVDFCQLELRILAHLSNDAKLMNLLDNGQDIFSLMASELNSVDAGEVSEEQRSQAKQVCYGIIYGMGPATLAEELEITEEAASAFYVSFKRRFPGVASWMRTTVEECRQLGYARTIANRIRHLPEVRSSISSERFQAERRAINTTVQGSASDVFKSALNAICARLRGADMATQQANVILQLHDEVIFEVVTEKAREVAILAKEAMEGAASLKVDLTVKLKVGVRWGDMVEIVL